MGYCRAVTWTEASAMELILFERLQRSQNLSALHGYLWRNYPDLMEKTGLVMFPMDSR